MPGVDSGAELQSALADDAPPIDTDAGWWRRIELEVVLHVLAKRLDQELANAVLESHAGDKREVAQLPFPNVTAGELQRRAELLAQVARKVSAATAAQDAEAKRSGAWRSLVSRVAEAYELSEQHRRILQLIVVINVGRANVLQNLLPAAISTMPCEPALIRFVFGLSEVEIAKFLDENDTHPLIKDRVLETDEDPYTEGKKTLKISPEVSRALIGEELSVGDKLKLSGTKFLAVIDGEEAEADAQPESQPEVDPGALAKTRSAGQAATQDAVAQMLGELGMDEIDMDALDLDDDDEEDGGEGMDEGSAPSTPALEISDVTSDPRAFTCELDYLNDQFQTILTQVKLAKLRIEDELKEAEVKSNRMPWWASAC